jgi:hypothetical protein
MSSSEDTVRDRGDAGFSILEVAISLVILRTVLVSVSSLMVTEFKVGADSRYRQVATEIATGTLDNEVQTGASALLGKVGDSTLANVTSAGQTYVGELEVSPYTPGSAACASPGTGLAMLKITVWETWANVTPGTTWWVPGTANSTGLVVEETTLLALPPTAFASSQGSLLVDVTGATGNGVQGVTVTVTPTAGGSSQTAITTLSGCALFANLTTGNWTVGASKTGYIDNLDDWSSSTNGATTPSFNEVVQADSVATVPVIYDQEATVTPSFTVTQAGASPWLPTNLTAMPLTFYTSYATSSPPNGYVASSPGRVFPFPSSPSYFVVAGSCGVESAPDGASLAGATTDGQPVTLTSGSQATVSFPLSPVHLVVDHGGTTVASGATVSAAVASSDTNCGTGTLAMPTLGLGTTCVPGVACASEVAYRVEHRPHGSHGRPGTLVTICTSGCWTQTTVTSSVSSATYGTPVTLNTSVVCTSGTGCSAPGNPNGGTETFSIGGVTFGTANVSTSSTATLTTSSLPVGSPTTVSAIYSNCSGCIWWGTEVAGTKALTISAAPTTTALASSPNPSAYGTSAILTATVSATSPSTATPTGTVNFKGAGTTITGCGAVTLSGGQATCTLSGAAGGSYSLNAVFTPSTSPTNFVTSTSSTLTQSVTAASTTTALTSSPQGASTVGATVTFTATVTPISGAPAVGAVAFKADGTVITGCSAVALSSGVATCATSALAVGSHAITTAYTPTTSTNFSASNGAMTVDVYSASAPSIESGLPYGTWVIYVTDIYVTNVATVTLTITPQGISVNGGANVSPGTLIEVPD